METKKHLRMIKFLDLQKINLQYQEEIERTRWVDNIEQSEIMLCNDADLTLFLLRWD